MLSICSLPQSGCNAVDLGCSLVAGEARLVAGCHQRREVSFLSVLTQPFQRPTLLSNKAGGKGVTVLPVLSCSISKSGLIKATIETKVGCVQLYDLWEAGARSL